MTVPSDSYSGCCTWGYRISRPENIPMCSCVDDPENYCFEVTVAGVTDDPCEDCDSFNRTYTLTFLSGCRFKEQTAISAEGGNGCSPGTVRCELFCVDVTDPHRWLLRFGVDFFGGGAIVADYEASPDDFDFEGSTVFSLDEVSSCSGWPSTVTLSKVACP